MYTYYNIYIYQISVGFDQLHFWGPKTLQRGALGGWHHPSPCFGSIAQHQVHLGAPWGERRPTRDRHRPQIQVFITIDDYIVYRSL